MMNFPLFETLCLKRGEVQNVALHQQRYEKALRQFYGENAVKIHDLLTIIEESADFSTAVLMELCRCRLSYNAQDYLIEFFPYQTKSYRHFQPVICDEIDYGLKYQDRALLNQLFAQRGEADEIMIIKQGKVTDCSIGNLIFREGNQWFTPETVLLNGTQRQHLLLQGKIQQREIRLQDIEKYEEIRLINAMNGLS